MMTRNSYIAQRQGESQNAMRHVPCALSSALGSQPLALRPLLKILLLFSAAFSIVTSARAQTPDTTFRELPERRSFSSKTYYNANDNTFKTVISSGYIHYQAVDGSYKDIDTNLRADEGGSYRVGDGLYKVRFTGSVGKGGEDDVVFEVPRPVHEKFGDPGKPPAPPSRLHWKILSLGYFNQQGKGYQVIQNANAATPVVSGSIISYPQIFSGIDIRYTCIVTKLKEEIVLSQEARENLPDPTQYGIARDDAYLMMAVEFLLTPNNIKVFARAAAGKIPVRQGNNFVFEGDDPIDFEDETETLHFFFPKDYAWAVNDSATGFANRVSVKRYFYSDRGKHYLLVGVPWSWINSAPVGTLIIDPSASPAVNADVWLESSGNLDNHFAGLLIGKAAGCCPKKRTLVKFNVAGASIPGSATILNAQFKLYYYSKSNGGSGAWVDRWVRPHQLLVDWSETQATYHYRVGTTPWNVDYVGLNDIDAKSTFEHTLLFKQSDPYGWKNWDLSRLTEYWVDNPTLNFGVVLWATNEDVGGYDLRFHSSDASPPNNANPPKLEVLWSNPSKTVYFLKDHVGSIRATVDQAGTVRGYDDYDSWGYIMPGRSVQTPWSTPDANLAAKNKFTGKEWDDEFGVNWYYFGARYYDPQIGRWLVRDPLAEKHPDFTPYNYVLNNPLILVDPDGKQSRVEQREFRKVYEQAKQYRIQKYGRDYVPGQERVVSLIGKLALGGLGLLVAAEASPYLIAAALSNPVTTNEIGTGITEALSPGAENLTVGAASKIANVANDVVRAAAKEISLINPNEVRFSQSSINSIFKEGGSIDQLAEGLRTGKIDPTSIPAIRLVEKDGKLYTLDNRRLEAFRRAGVQVPYRMATPEEAAAEVWKFTTKNEGTSIRVRERQ